MLGADQRPHLGGLVGRVADLHAFRRLDQIVEKAVVHRLLDQDPRPRAAVLAGVVEHGVRRGRSRALDVGVLEDHVRRFPAELQRDALDGPSGALHDEPADLGRAREPILATSGCSINRWPTTEPFPTRTFTTPSGIPASRTARQAEAPRAGQLRRLEDDGVSTGQCRPQLPARDVGREVPGTIRPTTPSGSRKVTASPPATGMVSPPCLSTAPA